MAIALEAFTVVVRNSALERIGGIDVFQSLVPNKTFCHDDDLARCAFMDRSDAIEFIESLFLRGLETGDGDSTEVVMVTSFDGSMKPDCDWLHVQAYKKGLIGWLDGADVTSIAAPKGWDPEAESALQRMSDEEAARRLKFVRRDENVEVFLDTETGRELYVGRTGLPLDQMYDEAKEFVIENMREPGAPRVNAELEPEFRRVIQMLQILSERRADSWTVHWLLGKSWHALGDAVRACSSLERAFELEKENTAVTRELAGICLELGKTTDAVRAAEAAVAHEPENAELLSNLALAYLLDARLHEAKKAVQAALKIDAGDLVNQSVNRTIEDVASGNRPQPRNLKELNSPKSVERSWWNRWMSRISRAIHFRRLDKH